MARPLRIQYPDAWYHVMNRGRRGEQVFESKDDYELFIELLQEAIELFSLRVSAFCLMPNHYHVLVQIQTPDANLSRSMRHINGVYAQRYNRKHFGKRIRSARRKYEEFIAKGMNEGRRDDLTGGGLIRSAGGWAAVKELQESKIHMKSDERILGAGGREFLAKTFPYRRARRNSIYDLHIITGPLWGERFLVLTFKKGPIIGEKCRRSTGRK